MTEKRYLFRGFHPNEKKGDTTITVDGKEIKGKWVIGYLASGQHIDEYGFCFNHNMRFETFKDRYLVIPETIGQWVTTDKNGKAVFEGDWIKDKNGVMYTIYYDNDEFVWKAVEEILDTKVCIDLYYLEHLFELIGNKWECEK